jgi:hypothetical protein
MGSTSCRPIDLKFPNWLNRQVRLSCCDQRGSGSRCYGCHFCGVSEIWTGLPEVVISSECYDRTSFPWWKQLTGILYATISRDDAKGQVGLVDALISSSAVLFNRLSEIGGVESCPRLWFISSDEEWTSAGTWSRWVRISGLCCRCDLREDHRVV